MHTPSLPIPGIDFRQGRPADAICVGVLATQVFLDTYATSGIDPKLAREVLDGYAPAAFETRLSHGAQVFLLAERAGSLILVRVKNSINNPWPGGDAADALLVELEVVKTVDEMIFNGI